MIDTNAEDVIWHHGDGLFGEWEAAYFRHLRDFLKTDTTHKIMETGNEQRRYNDDEGNLLVSKTLWQE